MQFFGDPRRLFVYRPFPDKGVQLSPVLVATGVVSETRIIDQLFSTHHAAEGLPLVFAPADDGGPSVVTLGAVDVVRGQGKMLVTRLVPEAPVHAVVHDEIAKHGDEVLGGRGLDEEALAGAATIA